MLGDLMAKGHDEEKAMHHYNVALNLDPKNVPAQEGLFTFYSYLRFVYIFLFTFYSYLRFVYIFS